MVVDGLLSVEWIVVVVVYFSAVIVVVDCLAVVLDGLVSVD